MGVFQKPSHLCNIELLYGIGFYISDTVNGWERGGEEAREQLINKLNEDIIKFNELYEISGDNPMQDPLGDYLKEILRGIPQLSDVINNYYCEKMGRRLKYVFPILSGFNSIQIRIKKYDKDKL